MSPQCISLLLLVHCIQPYEWTSALEELAIDVGQVEGTDTVRTPLFWQDVIALGLSIVLVGFLSGVIIIEHSSPNEQLGSGVKAALSVSSSSAFFTSASSTLSTSTFSTVPSLYNSSSGSLTSSSSSMASVGPASQRSGSLSTPTATARTIAVSTTVTATPIPEATPTPTPSPKPSRTATASASHTMTTTTSTSAWTHVYVVQFGDTLDSIAARFHVDPKILAEQNHIKNPNLLLVGQHLRVP